MADAALVLRACAPLAGSGQITGANSAFVTASAVGTAAHLRLHASGVNGFLLGC